MNQEWKGEPREWTRDQLLLYIVAAVSTNGAWPRLLAVLDALTKREEAPDAELVVHDGAIDAMDADRNQHGPGSFPQTCGHIARRPECYSCANRAAEARDAEIAALKNRVDGMVMATEAWKQRAEAAEGNLAALEAEKKHATDHGVVVHLADWLAIHEERDALKAQLSALKPTAEGIERAAKAWAEDNAFNWDKINATDRGLYLERTRKILEAHGPWSAWKDDESLAKKLYEHAATWDMPVDMDGCREFASIARNAPK